MKSEMATPKTRAMAEVDETQGDECECESPLETVGRWGGCPGLM